MKSSISIPKPCSEDWNKMAPTEKGAFCGKCQFDVIDFTNKQPEEIRSILKNNSGKKTCGHIAKSQLDMVNTNYHLWESQPPSRLRSKFLYACLMVFGFTLFTGCESFTDEHDVGDMEMPVGMIDDVGMIEEDTTLWNDDSTKNCTPDNICEDPLIDGQMEMLEGEIEMIEEDIPED
jgi:hypothetical protein